MSSRSFAVKGGQLRAKLTGRSRILRRRRASSPGVRPLKGRLPRIRFVQKSINDVLREAVRARDTSMQAQYDLVYCAGLFDYLSDKVCARLMQLMSGWLAADGLVLATNVHPRHTVHAILEDLLEWHLTLRTEQEMLALAAPAMGEPKIEVEEAGVNIIMTQRKTG